MHQPNRRPTAIERDTSLFSHEIARVIHEERQREIERYLQFRADVRNEPQRRSVRNRVGIGLIRIGSRLAPDGGLQLAARR
jgi:hypothetical protein